MYKKILLITAVVLICACGKSKIEIQFNLNRDTSPGHPYPDVSFAIISDLHFYDLSLGTSGAAFIDTMDSDRKLLLDSGDLINYAINDIKESNAGFVIITGDLTKDGELINHRIITEKLKILTDAGIAVYVTPGNHDVNCPDAVRYVGDSTEPVPSISADEFSQIYHNYGFGSAIMRDGNSLSYVAEPVDGLWLLAIDACRYRENIPGIEAIVSGKISQETADWIAIVLQTAVENRKAVMAFMHHGVVEHWKGQSKLHPDYLINDYIRFGEFLASWNVRLVFTGHYHAQDITLGQFGDKKIYDVETGSLVTYPCPIRYAEIRNNVIQFRTETIADKLHPGTDFAEIARAFVKRTVMLEAWDVLKKYRVSDHNADYIADAVGEAFNVHYIGDEDITLRPVFDRSKLSLWGRFIYSQQKYVLDGLWVDLPPADNNVSFNL
jgi:hypothetical protein